MRISFCAMNYAYYFYSIICYVKYQILLYNKHTVSQIAKMRVFWAHAYLRIITQSFDGFFDVKIYLCCVLDALLLDI